MDAGQSYVASPAVCLLSCSTRRFSGPYPSFSSKGNPMAPANPTCGRMASAGLPRRERMHNTSRVCSLYVASGCKPGQAILQAHSTLATPR